MGRLGARWGMAVAVFAVALLVYLPTIGFDFVRYDDPNYVQLHPRVSQGLTWDNLRWSMTAFEVGNWHPLTLVSHMADVSLFGMRPGAHHLVGAVLHALNAALLFALFDRATGRLSPSAFAAALFALHPLNVESVAWIAQRKTLLCMVLLLACLHAHVGWVRRGGAVRYLAGLVALAGALAAKPMAVAGPVLLLIFDLWPLRRPAGLGRLVAEKIPHALLTLAAAAVTVAAQKAGGALGTLESAPWGARAAHALFAFAWYPFRMVWPADLSLFYPTGLGEHAGWKVGFAAAFAAGAAAAALLAARRRPEITFGWAWYVASILPVAGLVQYGTQVVADRYAYLALIGPFVAIAFACGTLVARAPAIVERLAVPAVAGVLIALVVLQQRALVPWRSSEALLSRGVARAPDNAHALTNLGLLLVGEDRLDEGITLLRRAEAIVPLFPPVQINLGYALARQGNLAEARVHYEEAAQLRPDDAAVVLELGRVLAQLGENAEAERRLREAVAMAPSVPRAQLFLGTFLHAQSRSAEALPFLEKAASLTPDDARAQLALGLALAARGERERAEAALRRAIALDPEVPRAREELLRLAQER